METVEIGLFKDVNLLYSYVNRVEEARGRYPGSERGRREHYERRGGK